MSLKMRNFVTALAVPPLSDAGCCDLVFHQPAGLPEAQGLGRAGPGHGHGPDRVE